MMTTRFAAMSLALPLLSSLAACADTRIGYPSLAPRPVERALMQAEAAPVAPAAAASAAAAAALPAAADIAEIVARAQAADTAFRAAVEKARVQILAGQRAPEGSEAWVAGQQAYSAAEALRAPVGEALIELDRRREASIAAGRGDEAAAIAEAGLQVQALDEAGRALLNGLSAG